MKLKSRMQQRSSREIFLKSYIEITNQIRKKKCVKLDLIIIKNRTHQKIPLRLQKGNSREEVI